MTFIINSYRFANPTYIEATGGEVIRIGNELVHKFYGSGILTISQQSNDTLYNQIAALAVAGGAAASNLNSGYGNGGGAAGGFKPFVKQAVIGTHAIVIGAGGSTNSNGSDTIILSETAFGGGVGGFYNIPAGNGGSGGGASGASSEPLLSPGTGVVGQGNDGGAGQQNFPAATGGGGGGAGAKGQDATSIGGAGGAGLWSLIIGVIKWFSGGGGGGARNANAGAGGIGGGGKGGSNIDGLPTSGEPNTGGGGGGSISGAAGFGGSGFGAVRYYKPAPNFPSSLSAKLISRYLLDGNANDNQGLHNGTETNITYEQGKLNQGAILNGTNSKIDFGDVSELHNATKITLSAQIKTNSFGSLTILNKWNFSGGASPCFQLETTATGELFMFLNDSLSDTGGNNYAVTIGANIQTNSFYHVAVVFDGTQTGNANRLKFYVNGVQYSASFTGTIAPQLTAGTNTLKIGTFPGLGRYFDGQIDDVCIFSDALTITEVNELTTFYNS